MEPSLETIVEVLQRLLWEQNLYRSRQLFLLFERPIDPQHELHVVHVH